MSIEFEDSYYFSAAGQGKCQILAKGNEEQKFQFQEVTFADFKDTFSSDPFEWLGRKCVAIFQVPFCGIIKTIYHFAKAIFLGMPLLFVGETTHFKVHVYTIARDLQESFGWLVVFFYEEYGLYHVQEAEFHKSYYSSFFQSNLSSPEKEGIFREYLSDKKLDQAFTILLTISEEERPFDGFKDLSNAFIDNKEWVKGVKAASYIDEEWIKYQLTSKIIKKSFKVNVDKEVTREIISLVDSFDRLSNDSLALLANFFFAEENFEKAEQLTKLGGLDTSLLLKLAEHHLSINNIDKAEKLTLHVANEHLLDDPANPLLIQIATHRFNHREFDKAFEDVRKMKDKTSSSSLLIKLANIFWDQNEGWKMYKCVQLLPPENKKEFESRLRELIKQYCASDEIQKALLSLCEVSGSDGEGDLKILVAEAFLRNQKGEEAYRLVAIMRAEKIPLSLLASLIQWYCNQNNEEGIKKVLSLVIKNICFLRNPQFFQKYYAYDETIKQYAAQVYQKHQDLFMMSKVTEAIKEIHDAIYPFIEEIPDQSDMDKLPKETDSDVREHFVEG